MITHITIANYFVNLINNIYYDNLLKLYNIPLNDLFLISKFPIIKPDYFVFNQFYLIYLFIYHLSLNHPLRYSFFLHAFYISQLIYDHMTIKYQYIPKYNVSFLKNITLYLFMYLLLFKIAFFNIHSFKKTFLLFSYFTFFSLIHINEIYTERFKCITNKEKFDHPLKILIITPNKKLIQNIMNNTHIFTLSNFLLFINISLYLFI